MKPYFLVLIFSFLSCHIFSQFGKNGTLTVSTGTAVFNQCTSLSENVSIGQNTIAVTSIADLNIPTNLTCGDLIMIYQAQGANMNTTNSSTYGTITSYNNAGLFELKHVNSVNGNTITLVSALTNSYSVSGKTQVIRVPQFTSFIIPPLAAVTSTLWNGNKGGVLVIHASDSIVVNGAINNTGKGFRAGIARTSGYTYGGTQYVSNITNNGGEKGEGICGYKADYDVFGGRYCRGAAGNAGGGGTNHNGGGGGGANASNGNPYSGAGVMCTSCPGIAAWQMDIDYINNSNNYTNSSGGGKGGNSFSSSPQDPLTVPPGNGSWGSDSWRNVGGRGGRPLTNIDYSARVYFGGGGGAGDANDNSGGNGAIGGGIIILISPKITGNGKILANGDSAMNSIGIHADALGGGGGGGSIILNSGYLSNNLTLEAKGGKGGSMIRTNGTGFVIGTGGGGGGGYISFPNTSSPLAIISGGSTGKNYYPTIFSFPENGGTNGSSGLIQPSPAFTLITNYTGAGTLAISPLSNTTICSGQNAVIIPSGATTYTLMPGNMTGTNFTVNPAMSTTYTINAQTSCGSASIALTINVSTLTLSITPNQSLCNGQTSSLSATGATNYTWSPATGISNPNSSTISVTPTATTIYSVTGSNNNCTGSASTTISVLPLPLVSISPLNPVICAGNTVTLIATGADTYSFTGGVLSPSIVISPTTTTTYTVEGADSFGCTGSNTITVIVNNPPQLTLNNDTTICTGNPVILTANTTATAVAWGNASNSFSITVSPTITTNYSVTATQNGCIKTDSLLVSVTDHINAMASVDQTDTCSGNVQFKCLTNSQNNIWMFSNGESVLNNCDFSHEFSEAGTYILQYITNPNMSCADTLITSFTINPVPAGNTSTPNVFTPNDDGVNDIFDFSDLAGCKTFEFEIFDRWGLSILKSNTLQRFWDGRTTSGQPVTDGTYFYILKTTENSFKGTVTVFR